MGVFTAAVAIAAVATGGSLYYQNKAAREQKRMNQAQRRQADLQAAKQRRDTIRSNRLAHSQAVLNANAQGVSRSSGAMGGQDSILSQGTSNLSFMDTMNRLSDQASAAYGRAIKYGNQASIWGGIGSMAMTFASSPGMVASADKFLGKMFPGNKPPVSAGANRAPGNIIYKGTNPYSRPSTPHS